MKKKVYLIPLVLVVLGLLVPIWYAAKGTGVRETPPEAASQSQQEAESSESAAEQGEVGVEGRDADADSAVTQTADGLKEVVKSEQVSAKQPKTPSQTGKPATVETVPSRQGIKVGFAVVGKGGEVVTKGDVVIADDNRWGNTPLGALAASGVQHELSKLYKGFVDSIVGQKNEGLSGWMFSVNGKAPMSAATSCQVSEGDKVVWYYSVSIDTQPPKWDEL